MKWIYVENGLLSLFCYLFKHTNLMQHPAIYIILCLESLNSDHYFSHSNLYTPLKEALVLLFNKYLFVDGDEFLFKPFGFQSYVMFFLAGKCIACQSGATFFSISASSLTSKWVSCGLLLLYFIL